jgi:hypothetical protein
MKSLVNDSEIDAIYDHFKSLSFPSLDLDILVDEVEGEAFLHIAPLGRTQPFIKSFLLSDPECFNKVNDYYELIRDYHLATRLRYQW